MEQRRFARLATVICVLAPAMWMAGCRAGHPVADAAPDLEPLFQRVVVAPGDDPHIFPVPIDGANLIEIDRMGTLRVHTGDRVRQQEQPRAYQDTAGCRRSVAIHFEIAPAGAARLAVGPYDRTLPLVIEAANKHDSPGRDTLSECP